MTLTPPHTGKNFFKVGVGLTNVGPVRYRGVARGCWVVFSTSKQIWKYRH